ncbi:hypothetical protein [Mesorhizobium sp. M0571]|uniref:hypothetical protein n=1 Tax=Mesorhizobium sp. M0571 TaxID=2956960 RepID=UPI0033397A1D
MRRHTICVGVDYEFGGAPFAEFAGKRREGILAGKKRGEDLVIDVFDVRKGTRQTTEVRWSNGKYAVVNSDPKKIFAPVSRKSYRSEQTKDPVTGLLKTHYYFLDGQPDVMSIVDIYKHIYAIADKNPGTLQEVSIFSHGWHGGPILVNSFDDLREDANDPSRQSGIRDPDDKDGRAGKDFISPTMSPTQAKLFAKAFTTTGYFWIWGCNFPNAVNKFLSKVERSYSSIKETDVVKLSNLTKEEIEATVQLSSYLEFDPQNLIKTRSLKIPFPVLKKSLWAILAQSYPFRLAAATGVTGIGALVGTYAEYYQGDPPIMAVSSRTWKHVEFYKKYLNIEVDAEGRRYGIYSSSMLNSF